MSRLGPIAVAALLAMACTSAEPEKAPADAETPPATPADVAERGPDVGSGAPGDAKADPLGAELEGVGEPDPDRPGLIAELKQKEPGPEDFVVRKLPDSDATERQRRDGVLTLLAGGDVVKKLPLEATDGDREFDRSLVQSMTPRVRASVPRVRQKKATVSAGLDKDIVRRIVRAHINEVRYCYTQALVKNPKANGMLTLTWTINADGKVSKAKVKSNKIKARGLGECVRRAITRWKFPKPTTGEPMTVVYPFSFEPG